MVDTKHLDKRYNEDISFRLLVDTLYNQIVNANYTPMELRDAAMYAAIKYEYLHVRDQFIGIFKEIK